ncbi:MAG: Nif3-like dinuclear metal center hexameric protein, partial [Crocinitomicaceae bacterium]|nr:Nif3-like dinuclear metal center hexameric protein [Crocinitomicaceae bacterium]
TVIKAIKNDIAIYAIHTNLDNYRFGVNYEIGMRLGLKNLKILSPKSNVLNKISCFVPNDHLEVVSKAMFDAGAGTVGDYSNCGFFSEGVGTFLPNENAKPYIGESKKLNKISESRFEVICSSHVTGTVISAMISAHPYEEVAYDIITSANLNPYEGSGMVGELENEVDEIEFLNFVKKEFKCGVIRHTELIGTPIKKVAFCGGAGSFLLNEAKKSKADIFITGDYKYHEFFDAEGQIVIADIGHFESEQFTSDRIASILKNKFTTFALHLTVVITNPINYF